MAKKVKGVKVGLAAPQYCYGAMLKAFFKGDKRVSVGAVKKGKKGYKVEIKVNDGDMYDALEKILKLKFNFGKIAFAIDLIPSNKVANRTLRWDPNGVEAIECVLSFNPALKEISRRYIPMLKCYHVFAIFKPVVLQFACDNIASPWKLVSRVYEDAAREIFHDTGVSFCTDKE